MSLQTFEIMKELRKRKKQKNKYMTKKIEGQILSELKKKLDEYLSENDKVLFEIQQNFVGAFLNILNDSVLSMYSYEQVTSNKFIFTNKEIKI